MRRCCLEAQSGNECACAFLTASRRLVEAMALLNTSPHELKSGPREPDRAVMQRIGRHVDVVARDAHATGVTHRRRDLAHLRH